MDGLRYRSQDGIHRFLLSNVGLLQGKTPYYVSLKWEGTPDIKSICLEYEEAEPVQVEESLTKKLNAVKIQPMEDFSEEIEVNRECWFYFIPEEDGAVTFDIEFPADYKYTPKSGGDGYQVYQQTEGELELLEHGGIIGKHGGDIAYNWAPQTEFFAGQVYFVKFHYEEDLGIKSIYMKQ